MAALGQILFAYKDAVAAKIVKKRIQSAHPNVHVEYGIIIEISRNWRKTIMDQKASEINLCKDCEYPYPECPTSNPEDVVFAANDDRVIHCRCFKFKKKEEGGQ